MHVPPNIRLYEWVKAKSLYLPTNAHFLALNAGHIIDISKPTNTHAACLLLRVQNTVSGISLLA